MLIRKNTKAFKMILQLITSCKDKSDRENLIRLYITKAGHTVQDRISTEGIEGEGGLFYNMTYETVLINLNSTTHQLHHSDEFPGIYFFHSTSNKAWDETPFEFDEAIQKEFGSLSDLPVFRKKEKPQKFVFSTAKENPSPGSPNKKKAVAKKTIPSPDKGPKQPNFKLRHKIYFTELDKVIFRSPLLHKKDILDYYDKIAGSILPYLKDRPQAVHIHSENERATHYTNLDVLVKGHEELVPDWIETAAVSNGNERLLLCNDKEHLLLYAELGCFEFSVSHSRIKSLEFADYIILGINTPRYELGKAVDVANTTKDILTGLQLPSFVKTNGVSGLHIYIPLDNKTPFEISKNVAKYICKLIRLKIPNLVALEGSEDNDYGKVSLKFLINEEAQRVTAPYSLVSGPQPIVATPLLWEEVNEGLRFEDFNHESIFKRLQQVGDPFNAIFKKRVNAATLLERMDANYSFLLGKD